VVPDATSEQVPTAVVFAHVRQAVSHALLQQYPSTQKPLAHSLARVQTLPFVSVATQVPVESQRLPALHCASVVQPARHEPTLQVYGAHEVRAPCGAPVTLVQKPRLPETSHALHCSVQALSQQRPSTQLPLAQSVPLTHPVPLVSLNAQVP